MKLLLDMGNSRLKSTVLNDSGDLTRVTCVAYDGREPIVTLAKHLDCYHNVKTLVLVSVLGRRFYEHVVALCFERNISLQWVASEAQAHNVTNYYQVPEQLGSDRFVALVGARQLFPEHNCIVIDAGTAVTIDALTADGVFSGGVIIPGLKLWSDSLIGRADQLYSHQIKEINLFAKDTAQAIGSGSVFGLTGAIEGICSRMSEKLQRSNNAGSVPKFIICGGDAELISQQSKLEFELLPNLVLMGLAEYT